MAAPRPWPLRGRGRLPSVEFSLKLLEEKVSRKMTLYFLEKTFSFYYFTSKDVLKPI